MKLIVDVSEDIVDTLKCIETLSMEQEADLIDAIYEALNEEICEDAISRKDMALNIVSFYNKATGKKKTLDFLCKCVEGLPSVQPQPKTGHWIGADEWYHKCSECGEVSHFRWYEGYIYKWCPMCGAKMQ